MGEQNRVTQSDLERVVARLKMFESVSFDDEAINAKWSPWDAFPDVEDLADFDPTDAGKADAFLLWSRDASSGAFDDEGVLRHALPIRWGGSMVTLQMAFASGGMTVRIKPDEKPQEPYDASGWLVLSPRSAAVDCDLLRVLRAFDGLSERGIVALANAGYTASDGFACVGDELDELDESEDGTAVFWTAQKHDAFDTSGKLTSPLLLHWQGDAAAIVEGLREHGFTVVDAPAKTSCIEITGVPSSPAQPELEDVGEAIAASKPKK